MYESLLKEKTDLERKYGEFLDRTTTSNNDKEIANLWVDRISKYHFKILIYKLN